MLWLKKESKFSLIYQKIMRNLNILRDFLILVIRASDSNNKVLDLLRSREDFKKWFLATGDYGHELHEDLNATVGYNENFNNVIVRHALDLKNTGIFQNPNPLNLTYRNVKKFDFQNPIIGKLATQVKASKLTEDQSTKKILM